MMESYYRALETARRTVADVAANHGLEVLCKIPFDDELRRGDHRRLAPLDTGAPALESVRRLAALLVG